MGDKTLNMSKEDILGMALPMYLGCSVEVNGDVLRISTVSVTAFGLSLGLSSFEDLDADKGELKISDFGKTAFLLLRPIVSMDQGTLREILTDCSVEDVSSLKRLGYGGHISGWVFGREDHRRKIYFDGASGGGVKYEKEYRDDRGTIFSKYIPTALVPRMFDDGLDVFSLIDNECAKDARLFNLENKS